MIQEVQCNHICPCKEEQEAEMEAEAVVVYLQAKGCRQLWREIEPFAGGP